MIAIGKAFCVWLGLGGRGALYYYILDPYGAYYGAFLGG